MVTTVCKYQYFSHRRVVKVTSDMVWIELSRNRNVKMKEINMLLYDGVQETGLKPHVHTAKLGSALA